MRDYRQLALVATVHTARPHQHTAWQRFLRTGPLALLPLFDGSSSIVWSIDDGAAQRRCSSARPRSSTSGSTRPPAACSARRRCAASGVRFALHSLAAESYMAPRCALIGDAAHVIHPLAGQGANLGLLDAAALCEAVAGAVAQREDPGALRTLRGYEQQRRTHNLVMDAAMSGFQRGFARIGSADRVAREPRDWAWSNRSATLKRVFARQALGSLGGLGALPRLAR